MKAGIAWSGGKDCAWALRSVGRGVTHLITTFDEKTGLVPIHDVRFEQIALQAEALGKALIGVPLPSQCGNNIYVERFARACAGFDTIIFGDLYLADIRAFREQSFPDISLQFPLWGRNTAGLARQMIAEGLQARVTAATESAWIGRAFDLQFLSELPEGTDPCGENGEFHTWVEPECLASFP